MADPGAPRPTTDNEPSAVLVDKTTDGITTITLNRPHRRNAVDVVSGQKLRDAFGDFEDDPTQKVCVFTGANGTFCAGADLGGLRKRFGKSEGDGAASAPLLPEGIDYVRDRNRGPLGPTRMQLRKPVICAVAGFAVGGGLELSLIGDMRVVEENAVFGVFSRQVGVTLIDGGSVRLPALVGLGKAMDWIVTGRAIPADEALAAGLANRVVPKGKALEEALKIARVVAKFPQQGLNADRDSAYYSTYQATSFEDGLAYEFNVGIKAVAEARANGELQFTPGKGRPTKL